MWVLFYKKYAGAGFATFISILSLLLRYAGVLCLVNLLIPAAIVCIGLGVGGHFLAEQIAFSKWVKKVKSEGLEEKMRAETEGFATAVAVYNSNAGKRALNYITSVNAAAGKAISDQLASK